MNVLVTGGGGFLGSHLARRLKELGHDVTVFGRREYPEIQAAGIRTVQGDIRDAKSIRRACDGREAVFHAAALAGFWGPKKAFWETNVLGTMNVLACCRAANIRWLIHTSSPSVVFHGGDLRGVDETCPYPRRYSASYPRTKAEAERIVLAAHSTPLRTLALRPHLIFGPGDPHLFPRIIARAKVRRLFRIGPGDNLVDVTYIDNAVEAHVAALNALKGGKPCGGRAYFISQGQPVRLWPWLNDILIRLDLPSVVRSIPRPAAYGLGTLLEGVHRFARLRSEPLMTRFLASQLSRSHYFSIRAAERDLGYEPQVSTKEGVDRLVHWLKSVF